MAEIVHGKLHRTGPLNSDFKLFIAKDLSLYALEHTSNLQNILEVVPGGKLMVKEGPCKLSSPLTAAASLAEKLSQPLPAANSPDSYTPGAAPIVSSTAFQTDDMLSTFQVINGIDDGLAAELYSERYHTSSSVKSCQS